MHYHGQGICIQIRSPRDNIYIKLQPILKSVQVKMSDRAKQKLIKSVILFIRQCVCVIIFKACSSVHFLQASFVCHMLSPVSGTG